MLQVRVNIANGDMVGHTGDLEATIVGCTAADKAIKVAPPLSDDNVYETSIFTHLTVCGILWLPASVTPLML